MIRKEEKETFEFNSKHIYYVNLSLKCRKEKKWKELELIKEIGKV